MKIPFVGASNEARSLNASAQRALNCYLEFDNGSPRAAIALYGTPGMALLGIIGNGPHRAMMAVGSVFFLVSANQVYKTVYTVLGYGATFVGNVGTSTGAIGFAANATQVLIVDGTGGWLADPNTITITAIADPDFPTGVTRAAVLDEYFIVAGDGSGRFYWNESPGDGLPWNGLDYATAEGAPDAIVTILVDHRELWLFGSTSIELYVSTGLPDAPFARSGNTFIEHGALAPDSVVKLDNTIFWLDSDAAGGAMVRKLAGYTPQRVSNHAVEKAMQGYAVVSDARAFAYQQEGHSFYVLTFPTADKTWVYDVATNEWHERAWRDPDTNVLHRWRPACHVFFSNEHLVGDFESGNFYRLDLNTFTDNGDPILRLRATQCMDSEQMRMFFDFLQVDMETGVGLATGQGSAPQLMLRFSDDGGHTWSNIRTVAIGATGEYGARAIFRRLGKGRNRVWEISMSDPVKFAVFGANAKVRKGTS